MDNLLGLTTPASLSPVTLAINLLLCLLLSTGLAWFYSQYGRALSNRARFAQTLPLLAVTTALVISIVKSSLALSLGLVGALSIIRFRTAIKDPEELLYLFIAIAIGLGVGADQQVPTVVAVLVILGYLLLRSFTTSGPLESNLYLNLRSPNGNASLAEIGDLLRRHVESATLRRMDHRSSTLEATYLIRCPNEQVLVALMEELRSLLPDAELSFVEQDTRLGG